MAYQSVWPFRSRRVDSVKLSGDGWIAKYTTALADFKASKEIIALPAGMLATAIGAEVRHEKLDSQIQAVARNAIGLASPLPVTSGQRNVSALYAEAEIPVLKGLDFQVATRFDHYNDFGNSSIPKSPSSTSRWRTCCSAALPARAFVRLRSTTYSCRTPKL
ncbi:hypothetical protein BI344_17010 [Chromobacterium sphagni]|uniref:TonB-dependent receptor-like beta-barrel domain-containing protein n=1 Tax=Chromobacterium sphagni TaxID=1903179 RepID=A0ABX3CBU1_9NEIS|nr:hypothetical protein BI344_17010 [Chromobacterium sphagni]